MAITSSYNNVDLNTVISMFGIDPLKFNCLYPTCIEYAEQGCEQFWTQYYEKGNVISREELAGELHRAEIEVANYLGQFPFLTYITNEHINIEAYYRNRNQLGTHLLNYLFQTEWNCVQEFGVFEDEILGTGMVEYVDQDNDGFKELALITFDYSLITEEFNINDLTIRLKNYYNYNNKINTIIGIENNTDTSIVTFSVNSWDLVNPELYIYRKFTPYKALEACDADNYITEVDIVVTKKTCKPHGWIYFDENCATECEEVSYPFCAKLVDKRLGTFKIIPGTIDENGCFVEDIHCLPGVKPKRIEINYSSGCDECYKSSSVISTCTLIERAIIYLAMARLPRVLCECGCTSEYVEELKYDTSITYNNSNVKFNYPFNLRNNSYFGTKIGELEAYKILQNIKDKLC